MRRLAVALGVAAAAVAGVAWWSHEPAEVAALPEQPRVLANAEVAAAQTPAPVFAPADSPASRKLDELRTMSASVRNGTFVIAIRAAGFVCEDVVGVDQAEAGAPAWRARCPDLRAYLLSVAADGGLAVEPTLDHWDAVYPPIVPLEPPESIAPIVPRR